MLPIFQIPDPYDPKENADMMMAARQLLLDAGANGPFLSGHNLIRDAWDKLNDARGIFANFTRVAVLTTSFNVDFVWMLADHELWADLAPSEYHGGCKYVTETQLVEMLIPCYSANQT